MILKIKTRWQQWKDLRLTRKCNLFLVSHNLVIWHLDIAAYKFSKVIGVIDMRTRETSIYRIGLFRVQLLTTIPPDILHSIVRFLDEQHR